MLKSPLAGKSKQLFLVIFMLVGTLALYNVESFAFSSSFTNSATSSAKAAIERCRGLATREKNSCVASALDKLAGRISSKYDYRPAAKIIRRAAAKVRSAKTKKPAVAAVQVAKTQLQRSGLAEYKKLALVMNSAKSVLRSG